MKTSNKLLLGVAAFFLVVPLSAMIYESKNYIDSKDYKAPETKIYKFNDTVKETITKEVPQFSALVIEGKSDRYRIDYVEDTKFGVRISDKDKDFLSVSVSNGALTLNSTGDNKNNSYISIVVYSPNLNKISVNNLKDFDLNGTFNALDLTLKDLRRIDFGSFNQIKNLALHADGVKEVNFWETKIKNLKLDINNGDFESGKNDFDTLSIVASGKSNLIVGSSNNKEEQTVKNLNVTTKGNSEVEIFNVTVTNFKGSLSDSTVVNMPAHLLKKLYEKPNGN